MFLEALRDTLSHDANYEVVADCVSTIEAVEAIARHKPELVFVDAHIPRIELLGGKTESNPLLVYLLEEGSSLVKRLRRSELTFVFQGSRTTDLAKLTARIKKQLSIERSKRESKGLLTILAGKADRRSQRFAFRHQGKVVVLGIKEILWIEAENGQSCVQCLSGRYPLKMSFKAAMSRLSPRVFLQVNGSTVVNINVVRELRLGRSAGRAIVLEGGQEFRVSKSGASELKKLIDNWLLKSAG